MKLKIYSFTWESFSSDSVISVTFMTSAWEITILENHVPLLTSLRPSDMNVVFLNEEGKKVEENFAIWKWIIEVSSNNIKVMADMFLDMHNINIEEAESAKKKALELMKKYSEDKLDMEKYIEAEDLLLKSLAQLKLSDS